MTKQTEIIKELEQLANQKQISEVNNFNHDEYIKISLEKDLASKALKAIKELQEKNRSLVDQHEAEIMYYTGKIADFPRQVELLEKERTLALEILVRFEEENKQLQEEVEKHKNAFEQSGEEGKEIITELKAENEKLKKYNDKLSKIARDAKAQTVDNFKKAINYI